MNRRRTKRASLGAALHAIALAGAGAAASAVGCAQGAQNDLFVDASGPCTSSQTTCNGSCVDTKTDPDNCGGCGKSCQAGLMCVSGKCTLTCPGGELLCKTDGGAPYCVNGKSDNANCGGCNKACPGGQFCQQGKCTAGCGPGQQLCTAEAGAPYCANLKTDNANCGACGNACAAQTICADGQCAPTCVQDPDGGPSQTLCEPEAGAPYCAFLDTDNANCGTCGQTCALLEACIGGSCTSQCGSGQSVCGADAGTPYCASLMTDTANCGTCGNVCPQAKPVCASGTCFGGGCNRTALLLGDGVAASNTGYQTLLQNVGFAVNVQASGTTTYSGSPAANTFGVVIVTPGTTYSTDMPVAGQQSIFNAASGNGGTGVIFTEWSAYQVQNARYTTLGPIMAFTRTSGTTSTLTFTLTANNHPIWNGLPTTFTTSASLGANTGNTLVNGGQQIASCTQCSSIGVAVRDLGTGRVVQIAHAAAYNSAAWYNDTNLTKMMANAALWAARCQ